MTTPTTFWRLAGVSYVQVGSIILFAICAYNIFRVIWMVLLLVFRQGRSRVATDFFGMKKKQRKRPQFFCLLCRRPIKDGRYRIFADWLLVVFSVFASRMVDGRLCTHLRRHVIQKNIIAALFQRISIGGGRSKRICRFCSWRCTSRLRCCR